MLKDLFKEMFEGKASPEQEMKWGKEIEKEHGTVSPSTNITDDDPVMTAKIAKAHVNEIPDYYTRLRELEKQGKAALKEPEEATGELDEVSASPDAIKATYADMKSKYASPADAVQATASFYKVSTDYIDKIVTEATHGEVAFDTFDKTIPGMNESDSKESGECKNCGLYNDFMIEGICIKCRKKLKCRMTEAIEESRLTTYTAKIASEIATNIPGLKRVSAWSIADGTVGLYRYEDGNAYEITIRPASLAKHKDVFGNLLKKREDR